MLSLLNALAHALKLRILLWLVSVDQIGLAERARTGSGGSVMAGSTSKLGSHKNKMVLLILALLWYDYRH
jgi:hypothetical protein